jgi:molybdenum cofactor biosynthesis enzyme MoaA/dTDP-glucose pyrophosphorylase
VGCFKIVIAVNHLKEQIMNYFKDGKDFGVEIEYVEGSFVSTYDALYQSLNHLSSRILYVHANILFQKSLLENVIALGNESDKNVIAVIPNEQLSLKHAKVVFDNENNILAIDINERDKKFPYTFLGLAYYKKQDFIKRFNGNVTGMVEKLIQQLLDADVKTLAYQYKGDWRHIETEQDYLAIKQENKWGIAKIIPSLVINVTDNCNMDCVYCPPYGENLCQSKNEYDIEAVKILIQLAKQNHFKTLRLTGGEPLLKPERLQTLLDECDNKFGRLVLNTNGVLLNKYFDLLEKHKDNIVLKISLDSIDPDEYKNLTKKDDFNVVFNNIKTAVSLGFRVEINTVLVNQKLDNIKQLIVYYTDNKISIKLLTLSNYYGKVDTSICNFDLDGLIEYLDTVSKKKINEQLNGNRGISMSKYIINDTAVLFVDHSCKSSKTPIKCYFDNCEETCILFPCDSGSISISLSTDGIISTCRGRKDFGIKVFKESKSVIVEKFNSLLKQFENCIEINVNNIV